MGALRRLKSDSLGVALAVLVQESGEGELAGDVGRRFRFTNKDTERARWRLENLDQIAEAEQLAWPQLQRLLVHAGAEDLVAAAQATLGDDHPGVEQCLLRLKMPSTELNPQPLITGADVIALGVLPGPSFSSILDHVRNEQLLGHIHTRQQALECVDQWRREHPG